MNKATAKHRKRKPKTPTKEEKLLYLPGRSGGGERRRGLAEEMEEFLLSRQGMNCTASTLAWYERCMNKFRDYLERRNVNTTQQVTPSLVRRFLIDLTRQGHAPGGVATLFTGVRAYLKWFKETHDLEGWRPLAGVRTPRRPQDPLQPISLDDVRLLAEQCPLGTFNGDRDRAILFFLLDSGVRHEELTNLRMHHVDLQTGQVTVRWGKGRKTRTVFIGERTLGYLKKYLIHRPHLLETDPLWISNKGKKLAKSGIRQILRRLAERANIPEPGPHSFRRAYAINCLRNGMDLISLQRLMGHADLQTIQRYLAQVDDDLQEAHSNHGVVDNM